MLSSYFKVEKVDPNYFELHKHCRSYLEREKSGSLLFGDKKMQFTTVRSKEKDYDKYLKSKKLISQQLGVRKKCFPANWNWIKTSSQLFRT